MNTLQNQGYYSLEYRAAGLNQGHGEPLNLLFDREPAAAASYDFQNDPAFQRYLLELGDVSKGAAVTSRVALALGLWRGQAAQNCDQDSSLELGLAMWGLGLLSRLTGDAGYLHGPDIGGGGGGGGVVPSGNKGAFRGPAAKGYDWGHIIDHHAPWGSVAKQRKVAGRLNDVFENMTEAQIKASVQSAWKDRSRIQTQINPATGETRILYRGRDLNSGYTIEMWYNQNTGIVETAYPLQGR